MHRFLLPANNGCRSSRVGCLRSWSKQPTAAESTNRIGGGTDGTGGERDHPESIGEDVVITTEQIVTEAKEEVIEAPSRIRQILHQLAAMGKRDSVRSSASGIGCCCRLGPC